MEPNLAVSIYVRSSIKFLHFVPFHQQILTPRAILVSDWLLFKKIFSSETAWQNGAKLGRKHLCKILYKASFGSIRPTNMAAKIKKIFSETTWHRWFLGVSLSKLCPTAPPSIQDGCCFLR
jgi:purine-cytosine permease-like protein